MKACWSTYKLEGREVGGGVGGTVCRNCEMFGEDNCLKMEPREVKPVGGLNQSH